MAKQQFSSLKTGDGTSAQRDRRHRLVLPWVGELPVSTQLAFDGIRELSDGRELFVDLVQPSAGRLGWHRVRQWHADIGPLAGPRDDQLAFLQLGKRTLDRANSHPKVVGKRLKRREFLSRRDRAAENLGAQQLRNLHIRRSRVVRVEFLHVRQGTRPGQLVHPSEPGQPSLPWLAWRTYVSSVAVSAHDASSPRGLATRIGDHIETFGSRNAS